MSWSRDKIYEIHVRVCCVQACIHTFICELKNGVINSLFELFLNILGLRGNRSSVVVVFPSLPAVHSINLIQRDYKWNFTLQNHVQRLNSLVFKSMHDINHENCKIAQRRPSGSEILEWLMAWGVDDENSWDVYTETYVITQFVYLLLESFLWEEGGSDLLSDTTCFSQLNICVSNFI